MHGGANGRARHSASSARMIALVFASFFFSPSGVTFAPAGKHPPSPPPPPPSARPRVWTVDPESNGARIRKWPFFLFHALHIRVLDDHRQLLHHASPSRAIPPHLLLQPRRRGASLTPPPSSSANSASSSDEKDGEEGGGGRGWDSGPPPPIRFLQPPARTRGERGGRLALFSILL